jgi:excisionase family DNA binding protein
MNEPLENLISMTEAAEKLGISRKRVFDFIKTERLPAQKIGKTYVIREADLELVRERKTGRPVSENPSKGALAKRRQREQEKQSDESENKQ